MHRVFRGISDATAALAGSPWTFVAALVASLMWIALGPWFGWSDTWQLTMNTAASQLTFLIAFLLQNTQNRDTRVLQLKIDELLRATDRARNEMIRIEDLSDEELERLQREFERLRQRPR
jgi:low affinity Fe/Cu permease